MSETSLQQVIALNRELTALAATGLPLDIGLGRGESLEGRLDSINTAFSTRVARGESIEQIVRSSPEMPARYRAGLWAWIHHPDPSIALNGFAVPAEARRDFGRYVGRTLFYPLLLLCLAYLGLVMLCLLTAPALEALFEQLFQSTERIQWLSSARALLPFWAPLFPLLMILVVLVWRQRFRRAAWNWVPGSRRYYDAIDHANLANQLALLIESGRTPEEAIALLQAPSTEADARPSITVDSLPSLLKWALTARLPGDSLPSVLHLVAESYRQTSERQQHLWRMVMPTIAGAVLGGVVVMAYGLGLFLPIIELLRSFSTPVGA